MLRSLCRHLMIGLLATVAIAWLTAAFVPLGDASGYIQESQSDSARWVLQQVVAFGAERRYWIQWDSLTGETNHRWFSEPRDAYWRIYGDNGFRSKGPTILDSLVGCPPTDSWSNQQEVFRIEDVRGFPLPALGSELCERMHPMWGQPTWRLGISLPPTGSMLNSAEDPAFNHRALPFYPLPIGLVVDTLVWATASATLTFAWRTRAQRRRYRRGICPRCAYDRSHDYAKPCPECGHASVAPGRAATGYI